LGFARATRHLPDAGQLASARRWTTSPRKWPKTPEVASGRPVGWPQERNELAGRVAANGAVLCGAGKQLLLGHCGEIE